MNPTPHNIRSRKSNTRNWVNTTNSDSNSIGYLPQYDSTFAVGDYPKCNVSLRGNTLSRSSSFFNVITSSNPNVKSISTLKHAKSLVSLRRSTQMAIQSNPVSTVSNNKPVAKTRLRLVRHIIGFRSYNKVQLMEASIVDTIASIKLLINQPFRGLQYATETADSSLDELQQAESSFFCVADRITRYETKLKELEFIRANMEKCITASIAKARQDFQLLEHSSESEYQPLFSKLDGIIGQPWRDHNQLRICINELKCVLIPHSCLTEAFPGLVLPSIQDIHKLMRSVEEYTKLKKLQPKLKQVFTANVDAEELRFTFSRLKKYELQLAGVLSLEQAAASVVLAFAMEARDTAHILRARTEEIALSLTENAQRDVDAEENALYEFIYSGREYERQNIDSMQTPALHRVFAKSMRPNVTTPSLPIWAQHWTDKTKLLKRKL